MVSSSLSKLGEAAERLVKHIVGQSNTLSSRFTVDEAELVRRIDVFLMGRIEAHISVQACVTIIEDTIEFFKPGRIEAVYVDCMSYQTIIAEGIKRIRLKHSAMDVQRARLVWDIVYELSWDRKAQSRYARSA